MSERRILIQDRSSGLFYVGLDQWTATEQKALVFPTAHEAARVISRAHLKNVKLVNRH
jgi:phage portal protein BeeE